MFISYIKIVVVSHLLWVREHRYHGKNFEEMTQYGEFGCIFKIFHFLCKHNDIISVEGSSIVLYIECLGGMLNRELL